MKSHHDRHLIDLVGGERARDSAETGVTPDPSSPDVETVQEETNVSRSEYYKRNTSDGSGGVLKWIAGGMIGEVGASCVPIALLCADRTG